MERESYSPGLEGIIAGASSICQVDEEGSGLLYRGYSLEDLARHSTFEEVAYLLLIGELPSEKDLSEFSMRLSQNREIPDQLIKVYKLLPSSAHPMDLLKTGVSILGLYDPELADNSHGANLRKAIRLIAQMPTLMAGSYRIAHGRGPILPDIKLSHASNLLYLLSGEIPDENVAKILDISLILYAEHEFNTSAFCARVTASSLSDVYSAITSAIGTLKGPLHGGANEAVMRMLFEIGEVDKTKAWVTEALAKKRRIMGFGHRVYKKGDRRSDIMKELSRRLGEKKGERKWYEISSIVEEVMFKEKGLYPNLDLYSATVYYILGLPIELFTPVFVCSRVAGWTAHVIEQHNNNRLIRPRCLYTGQRERTYIPLKERKL